MNRQLKSLNNKLSKIRKDITPEDRRMAMQEVDIARPVLSNYLNGKAASIETGMKLLFFFKKRVEERTREIQNA